MQVLSGCCQCATLYLLTSISAQIASKMSTFVNILLVFDRQRFLVGNGALLSMGINFPHEPTFFAKVA